MKWSVVIVIIAILICVVILPIRLLIRVKVSGVQPLRLGAYLYSFIPILFLSISADTTVIRLKGTINKTYQYSQLSMPKQHHFSIIRAIIIKKIDHITVCSVLKPTKLVATQALTLIGHIASATSPNTIKCNTLYTVGEGYNLTKILVQTSIIKVIISLIKGAKNGKRTNTTNR